MKNTLLILAMILVLPLSAFAEKPETLPKTQYLSDRQHKTAFSAELLGRGGAFSLNVDHLVTDNIALGVGISAGGSTTSGVTTLILPIYANFYFATENSRPYFTAGASLSTGTVSLSTIGSNSGASTIYNVGAGWEFRADNGFLFRFSPYYLFGSGFSTAWVGIGFGWAF